MALPSSAALRRRFATALQGEMGSRLVLEPIVEAAYRRYRKSDETWSVGYSAMRKLFGSRRSRRFEALAAQSAGEHPRLPLDDCDGIFSAGAAEALVALNRDGLVVLEAKLPSELWAPLEDLARSAPCTLTERAMGAPERGRFDPTAPVAVRYDVIEEALLDSEVVQVLLADRSLLSVAQEYLGGAPVHDLVAMWWTTPSSVGSSETAQQFHFDLDRLRFLKLFVYLTDVGPSNGPHHFIRGSHRDLPLELRADRRFSDDEVFAHYGRDVLISVTGERGTMFLADTRGLHKGLNVEEGHRLVFQLEFATSLFGKPVDRPSLRVTSRAFRDALADFPATYRRLQIVS